MYRATAVVNKLLEQLFDGSQDCINEWGRPAVPGTARWNYSWQKLIYKHQSEAYNKRNALQISQ